MTNEELHERNIEFTNWRKKVANGLPDLANRVFALRGSGYMGCGFHWAMERDLGVVLCQINDYDDGRCYYGREVMMTQTAIRVRTELLYQQVKKAEESIAARPLSISTLETR